MSTYPTRLPACSQPFGARTLYVGETSWATERLAAAVKTHNDRMAAGDATAGVAESFALSMSVGSAQFTPDDPAPLEALLERADAAL